MAKISLYHIDALIDSAVATGETNLQSARTTAIGTAPEGYQTLGALYDHIMTISGESASLASDIQTFLGSDTSTTYGTMSAIANRIAELQVTLSQTDADSEYDTFQEIAAYLAGHEDEFTQLKAGKFSKSNIEIGTSNFGGMNSDGTVSISHTLNSTNITVIITPTADAGGAIGDYSVTNITDVSFDVLCTGSAITSFNWLAIKN